MPLISLRDGQKLHVRVLGRGQPVMMLPGLGMSSSQWLPYIVPYLRQFRFYLPDFRGFGLSADVRLNQSLNTIIICLCFQCLRIPVFGDHGIVER